MYCLFVGVFVRVFVRVCVFVPESGFMGPSWLHGSLPHLYETHYEA